MMISAFRASGSRPRLALLAGAAVGAAIWGAAFAADAQQAPVETPAALPVGDLAFVLHVNDSNTAEIVLGELAQEKASEEQVREFGRKMVEDHTKSRDELLQIAESKGASPPTEPSPNAVAIQETLAALAEPGFDGAYMSHQVGAHKMAVTLFQHCSESCTDPALKSFASEQLPIVREHLMMAEQLLGEAERASEG